MVPNTFSILSCKCYLRVAVFRDFHKKLTYRIKRKHVQTKCAWVLSVQCLITSHLHGKFKMSMLLFNIYHSYVNLKVGPQELHNNYSMSLRWT